MRWYLVLIIVLVVLLTVKCAWAVSNSQNNGLSVHPVDGGWKFKGNAKVYINDVRQPGWVYDGFLNSFYPIIVVKKNRVWLVTHQLMGTLIAEYEQGINHDKWLVVLNNGF